MDIQQFDYNSPDAAESPALRLRRGQQVAVSAGDGIGWLAEVKAVRGSFADPAYLIQLADGRHLVKHHSELAELCIYPAKHDA